MRCYCGEAFSVQRRDCARELNLQELIDHTAKRLLHSMTEDEIAEIDDESLIMYSKWGCDGASGQCEYSQKLGDKELCDSNLFMTSIVPLNLSCRINNNVVWKNERPSSTRYCRCIQFQFAKETPEKIRAEKNRVDAEIAQIQDSVVDIRNRVFKVRHEFFFTMLDGKTAQAVTETPASSSCFICLATTSQMNCLEKIKARPINPEAIKFGMSPLHARIKFMEYILHIAYNLPIMCWKTNAETRPIKEKRKAQIQNEFAEKTGLRLDMVKQGKGTTNDGNTSRRFFANPALASEITGVKEEIINRCAVILEAITCTEPVDSCKFDNYAYDTAKMLVANYGWYNMPSSVHKVLLHGKQIIENCTFSVGALSEEAQECRNKDYKRYRNLHTRKCDRVSTNEDVMHMMLLSSDPFINKLRPTPKKKFLILSDEAKNLLRDINNNE